MTEEKEVMAETNGVGEEETNGKESITEEASEKTTEAGEENNDEDITDLDAEIIRQVEYYFGDSNLPRDKFLNEQMKLDDGWIPLQVLMRFNRLSKLSSDVDVIEKALSKSTSGLLEVADKKVRRHPDNPMPEYNEEHRKEVMERTIYMKGFPKDSTLDELLKFFKNYDGIGNVIMRRYNDSKTKKRVFKGSIFATFNTKEQAAKFIEIKDFKYKDAEMLVLWQSDYVAQKQEEFVSKKERKEKKQKKQEEPAKQEISLPSGTVLFFDDGHDKLSREDIKSGFVEKDKAVDIAFIDFKLGLTKGWIRFNKENGAVEFLKLLEDGKIKFGNHQVVLKLLEGDEEKEYLKRTVDEMLKRRKNMKTFRQGKGRNNYKGKHMKRRRDEDNQDAPPAKIKCDES